MTTTLNRCPTCQTPEKYTTRGRTLQVLAAALSIGIILGFAVALLLILVVTR